MAHAHHPGRDQHLLDRLMKQVRRIADDFQFLKYTL